MRRFEPFFTTKPGGTGLGLATVYGIVAECGGTVSCTSQLGEGTMFELRFPAIDEECPGKHARTPAAPVGSLEQTVLLVEDEASVRTMARRILEHAGCTVVEASNGEEALRHFSASPARFDAILTDMVMPILNGTALAAGATEIRSDVPIVFMSGYIDHLQARQELSHSSSFLQKPFRAEELVDALRAAKADSNGVQPPP